jgi:arylsulfatase A-like enzyme
MRALAILLLSAVAHLPAADVPKKNVLFIIADDLNNMLGCYGDKLAKTPNIDKLAARGTRFDKGYCTFPLCGPSRNSMLTGLYPNSTGIQGNSTLFRYTIPDQLSMSQAFRQQGYFAARIGKLYHYNVPNSIGTNGHDDPASWELELNAAGVDRLQEHPQIFTLTPKQFGGTLSWYASPAPEDQHTDTLAAKDAEWVLERCAKPGHRPFFLAVGFFRPHTPYVSPKSYFDLYPEAEVPVVTGIKEDQADLPPAALGSAKKEQDKLTDDLRRKCQQAYRASISYMDTQVGTVVAALDRLGLAEKTVIVFTSDHGYHMGEHGLWQKQSLFEESSRVPYVIVAPGAKGGNVVTTPVSQVDLFPTLAELCGVQTPTNLQGQSLVPLLADPAAKTRGWALTQVVRGGNIKRYGASAATGDQGKRFYGYSLRTDRYRYTEWDEGKAGAELYDHDSDPKELTNLAKDPTKAPIIAELSTQMKAAVKTTLPPDGKVPALSDKPEMWAPLIADP